MKKRGRTGTINRGPYQKPTYHAHHNAIITKTRITGQPRANSAWQFSRRTRAQQARPRIAAGANGITPWRGENRSPATPAPMSPASKAMGNRDQPPYMTEFSATVIPKETNTGSVSPADALSLL